MYPKIDFLGKLTVNNIVSYKVEDNKKSLDFYLKNFYFKIYFNEGLLIIRCLFGTV